MIRKLRGHCHLGLPEEVDVARTRHCPLGVPYHRLRGQEVNPIDMIRLSLCFGDKLKARNLEVAFLVVDVPTVYNFILGRPTLHKVNAMIAPCFLQLQFEANGGSMGVMHIDQRMARECYLMSIRPW